MKLVKCETCHDYFEEEDVQKVERKMLCYGCVKQCKNCERPYEYPDASAYCYYCLEGNLV